MYCIHCGKWFDGQSDTCPDCTASNDLTDSYMPPVSYPAGNNSEDFFQITPPQTPKKKKKKKKKNGKRVALICVLAAVAAIAVLAVVFWDNITGLFQQDSSTPAEYLQNTQKDALNAGIDTFTDSYAQMLNSSSTGNTSTSTEMHLLLGDDVLEMLEMLIEEEGIPLRLDWLSDIKITGTVNGQNNIYQATMGVGLGSTTLLTANIIADIAGDRLWMGFPELSSDYLCMNNIEQLSGVSMADLLATSQISTQEMLKAMPAPEVLNSLLKKYGALVIACIQDVTEAKQTVTQDGFTQEFTVLTANIHLKDALSMGESLLTELKNDPQAQDVLVKIAAYGNTTSGYYVSEAELKEELLENIDEALEDIRDDKNDPSLDDGSYVQIITYLNSNNQVCGYTVTVQDGARQQQLLRYLVVHNGNQFSLDAVLAEATLTGTGTWENNVLNGDFRLTANGTDLFQIQLVDVTETGGKIRLVPSRVVLETILDEMDISASGIISNMNIVLEMEVLSSGSNASCSLKLLTNQELLVGITLTSAQSPASNVRLPSGGVDIMDNVASYDWVAGLDFSTVLNKMSIAGVPSELVQVLDYLLENMQASMASYA